MRLGAFRFIKREGAAAKVSLPHLSRPANDLPGGSIHFGHYFAIVIASSLARSVGSSVSPAASPFT
jgi:hypothetical protein